MDCPNCGRPLGENEICICTAATQNIPPKNEQHSSGTTAFFVIVGSILVLIIALIILLVYLLVNNPTSKKELENAQIRAGDFYYIYETAMEQLYAEYDFGEELCIISPDSELCFNCPADPEAIVSTVGAYFPGYEHIPSFAVIQDDHPIYVACTGKNDKYVGTTPFPSCTINNTSEKKWDFDKYYEYTVDYVARFNELFENYYSKVIFETYESVLNELRNEGHPVDKGIYTISSVEEYNRHTPIEAELFHERASVLFADHCEFNHLVLEDCSYFVVVENGSVTYVANQLEIGLSTYTKDAPDDTPRMFSGLKIDQYYPLADVYENTAYDLWHTQEEDFVMDYDDPEDDEISENTEEYTEFPDSDDPRAFDLFDGYRQVASQLDDLYDFGHEMFIVSPDVFLCFNGPDDSGAISPIVQSCFEDDAAHDSFAVIEGGKVIYVICTSEDGNSICTFPYGGPITLYHENHPEWDLKEFAFHTIEYACKVNTGPENIYAQLIFEAYRDALAALKDEGQPVDEGTYLISRLEEEDWQVPVSSQLFHEKADAYFEGNKGDSRAHITMNDLRYFVVVQDGEVTYAACQIGGIVLAFSPYAQDSKSYTMEGTPIAKDWFLSDLYQHTLYSSLGD